MPVPTPTTATTATTAGAVVARARARLARDAVVVRVQPVRVALRSAVSMKKC